ncbi:MAG: TIM barrel protein [Cyclobacteriaceae bacterium]|nr:TIM barrel protein [Cyclobacteriaceae bacterium]
MGIWYLDGLNVQKVSADIPKDFDYNLSREELLLVRKKLLEKGVSVVNYYIHDIPNDDAVCRQIFEFGKTMGIEAFIAEPKPEALDLIEKYCIAYNIKLAVHNHGKDISLVYWDPKNLLKAIEKRNSLIGACADIGYWQRNGFDPIASIEVLKNRLITIQVHDLHEKSSKGHDVAWGTGISNLDEVFNKLNQAGIKPTLIGLEYSYNWGKSMNDIIASRDYFDRMVIRLATQIP